MIIGSMIIKATSSKTMELNFDCFEQYLGQGFTRLFSKITNYILGLDRGGWYWLGMGHIIVVSKTSQHHLSIERPNIFFLLELAFSAVQTWQFLMNYRF